MQHRDRFAVLSSFITTGDNSLPSVHHLASTLNKVSEEASHYYYKSKTISH